jgi:hypothetical protein
LAPNSPPLAALYSQPMSSKPTALPSEEAPAYVSVVFEAASYSTEQATHLNGSEVLNTRGFPGRAYVTALTIARLLPPLKPVL